MNNIFIVFCFIFNIYVINEVIATEKIIDFSEDKIEKSESDLDVFSAVDNQQSEFMKCSIAKVIALNKVTAKSQEFIFDISEEVYFGNIKIKVHKCFKSLNPYSPDNQMLLTIIENKIDEDQLLLFQGWMSSSRISLSTFESPIYEVFPKECLESDIK
jgi:hypothetical protein